MTDHGGGHIPAADPAPAATSHSIDTSTHHIDHSSHTTILHDSGGHHHHEGGHHNHDDDHHHHRHDDNPYPGDPVHGVPGQASYGTVMPHSETGGYWPENRRAASQNAATRDYLGVLGMFISILVIIFIVSSLMPEESTQPHWRRPRPGDPTGVMLLPG